MLAFVSRGGDAFWGIIKFAMQENQCRGRFSQKFFKVLVYITLSLNIKNIEIILGILWRE
jgi:hypothetical protein